MCSDSSTYFHILFLVPRLIHHLKRTCRHALDVEKRVRIIAKDRRLCITTSGRLGWISKFGREGDIVSLLFGSTVHILLRPRGETYEVIEQRYIHGMMDGEVPDEAMKTSFVPVERIDLV